MCRLVEGGMSNVRGKLGGKPEQLRERGRVQKFKGEFMISAWMFGAPQLRASERREPS